MPSVQQLFIELEKEHSNAEIAGYVDRGTFNYHLSTNAHLPAAASMLDLVRGKSDVYTNLSTDHWLYTYTKPNTDQQAGLLYKTQGQITAEKGQQLKARQVNIIAGEGSGAAPFPSGGLFEAAKALNERKTPAIYTTSNKAEKIHSKEKGYHRALRYYMLAAYSLLGKCAESNKGVGNYIAALLVADTGEILSYGVNSKGYHHGEVNMLMNYFRRNPGQKTFPEKTIVFSTLTPCLQCFKYIEAARPTDSVIFMGQQDTGGYGSAGESKYKYLRSLTDPLLNREVTMVTAHVPTGRTISKSVWGNTVQEQETAPVQVQKVEHTALEQELSKQVSMSGEDGSVAQRIGEKCVDLLHKSNQTLTHKFNKQRPAQADSPADTLLKVASLNYLDRWLKTANRSVESKSIA